MSSSMSFDFGLASHSPKGELDGISPVALAIDSGGEGSLAPGGPLKDKKEHFDLSDAVLDGKEH